MTPADLAAKGLRVKPLEWVDCSDGSSHDTGCQYEVDLDHKYWRLVRASTGPKKYIGHFNTVQSARAAADADHAARIAAMIEQEGEG
jgi:hypothetical protein